MKKATCFHCQLTGKGAGAPKFLNIFLTYFKSIAIC